MGLAIAALLPMLPRSFLVDHGAFLLFRVNVFRDSGAPPVTTLPVLTFVTILHPELCPLSVLSRSQFL